jgi:Domain of unknown function (DUF4150)
MAGDTDKGTGTVKICGKTVNIKNKSYLTKTTGTEAGCAAKKGAVTSKNTGKEYFNSWSNNVKFDGEPVVRMTDLATNNHASPVGNAPPWPHIAGLNVGCVACAEILAKVGMKVHAYKHADKECESGKQQSDHILQKACFHNTRGGDAISTARDYQMGDAPCVCLEDATDPNTEHGRKTKSQNEWAKKQRAAGKNPTYQEVVDTNMKAMKEAKKPDCNDGPDGKEHPAIECLRMICDLHFKPMMAGDEEKKNDTHVRTPATGQFKPTLSGTTGSV